MAIELPIDRQSMRPWIVAETTLTSDVTETERPSRWLIASRRFAPAMVPDPIVLTIDGCVPASVRDRLRGHSSGIVLWNADSADDHGDVFDAIATLAIFRPDVLQFVAAATLTDDQRLAAGELGVAAIIDQPERLPFFGDLARRYWSQIR